MATTLVVLLRKFHRQGSWHCRSMNTKSWTTEHAQRQRHYSNWQKFTLITWGVRASWVFWCCIHMMRFPVPVGSMNSSHSWCELWQMSTLPSALGLFSYTHSSAKDSYELSADSMQNVFLCSSLLCSPLPCESSCLRSAKFSAAPAHLTLGNMLGLHFSLLRSTHTCSRQQAGEISPFIHLFHSDSVAVQGGLTSTI